MPELKNLVICEKVIVDRVGAPSLIGILTRVSFYIPEPQATVPNSLAPFSWSVFSQWQVSPSEVNREFVQRAEAKSPDGNLIWQNSTRFLGSEDGQSRVILQNFGLPIGTPGEVVVRAWLEGNEDKVGTAQFQLLTTSAPPSLT